MEITTGIVLALLVARSIISLKSGNTFGKMSFAVLLTASILCLVALVSKNYSLVKAYPILMSSALAIVFGYSLCKGNTPVIESIARLHDKNLSENGVMYTRKVTKVWLSFFIFNALTSLYTLFYSELKYWTLYNGLISYILIGLLFGIEFFVRKRLKKKWGESHGA